MTFVILNILHLFSFPFQEDGFRMNSKKYNLTGSVRNVTEMKVPAYLESGIWVIDSSEIRAIRKSVKSFDENGLLDRILYLQGADEVNFFSIMLKSDQGTFQGSDEYDAQKQLQSKTEVLSADEGKLETLTVHATTQERLSKSESTYKNGLLERQIRTYYGRDAYLFYKYKRDFRGNEIEIQEESRYDGEVFSQVYTIQYLEYDKEGNWTRRKECDVDGFSNCSLTIRSITYYK